MLFSIQRYIEDYLNSRGFIDNDQYAIKLSNVFYKKGVGESEKVVRELMKRMRTKFFLVNAGLVRESLEKSLAQSLVRKFKKKGEVISEAAVAKPVSKLKSKRRTIRRTIQFLAECVEASGVDAFWNSRSKGNLKKGPEKIAQGLVATALRFGFDGDGIVVREIQIGTGFADIGIVFGKILHLVELKILDGKFTGVEQLSKYMKLEGRLEGWLLVFDARPSSSRSALPDYVDVGAGRVFVVAVDINPTPPSKLKPS